MNGLRTLRQVLHDHASLLDGRHVSSDLCEASLLSLELVIREFLIAEELAGLSNSAQSALEHVKGAITLLNSIAEGIIVRQNSPPVVCTGRIGRPPFMIPREQLFFLIENNFTAPHIAEMIGVSLRTVHRRISEYGLSISARYSTLTDEELDQIVDDIQGQFPTCGNRQMNGHLLSRGYRIQQCGIRESQQ